MRCVALSLIVAALVAVPAAAAVVEDSEDVGASVSPGQGNPRTTLKVSFTSSHDTGIRGMSQSDYSVYVSRDGGDQRGCGSSQYASAGDVKAGTNVKVRLRPPAGGWCRGNYTGEISYTTGPYCEDYTKRCPMFPSQYRTVGHFTFRVKRR